MIPGASGSTLFPYTTLFRSPSALIPKILPCRQQRHARNRRHWARPLSLSPPYRNYWRPTLGRERVQTDRKSTRLNSSHMSTSYAVFCLKKKNLAAGAASGRGSLSRDYLVSYVQ